MKKSGRKFASLLLVLALIITQFSNGAMTALAASDVQITVNGNKKVDVALAVGSTSVDYSSFESKLREAIGDRIPESSLNIMATTSVDTSTSSDFEWLKFDHSLSNGSNTNDFIDPTGVQMGTVYDNSDSHVILDTTQGTKLTFNGYGRSAYSDFMLLENNQTTNKTFQFDIKEYFAADALYNIGFFFNSNLSYDTEKYTGLNAMYDAYQADELLLNGYIMTLEYNGNSTTGIAIYKIVDLKLKSFHNDSNAQLKVGGNAATIKQLEENIKTYTSIAESMTDPIQKQAYLDYVKSLQMQIDNLKGQPSNFTLIASLSASIAPSATSDATVDSNYRRTDDLRKFRVEVTPTSVSIYYAGFDDETHTVSSVSNESAAKAFDENSEGYKAFAGTSYENLTALNFTLASDTSKKVTTIPLDATFKTGGNDFGPMVKYGSHGCQQLTKVELSNLTMATDVVRSLNEVIREPQWSKDSSKFLVNLNEDPIEDFDNEQVTGELLNRLKNDDIHYVGWCSDNNEAKSSEFLAKNDLKGDIVNINNAATDTLDKQIKEIADLIVARYQAESQNNANVITAGNAITLNVTGAETTNTADSTYPDGKWTIKFYDTEGTLVSTTTVSNLVPDFVVAGTYEIYYCGTLADNLVKTIILNAPPKAQFDVQVASGAAITATLTNNSVDLEKSALTSKWTYSEVGSVSGSIELTQDASQNATLTMEEGKIYLISLTVMDKWGASATTSQQISYDPSEAALPIADFTISVDRFIRNASGDSITGSNIITVTDKSYDLYGKAVNSTFKFTTGAAITMEAVPGQPGVYSIDTSGLNAGTYSIYLITNNGSKDSKRVARTFKIIKDETGPTATSSPKAGAVTLPMKAITVSFSDNGGSGVQKQKTLLTTSTTTPTTQQWEAVPYSYYDTKSISVEDMEGTYYIHYLAEDKLGNINTAYVGPFDIDTKAPGIASKVSPAVDMKEVAVAPQIQFTVSEIVTKGDGYLYIKKASDNSVVYSIPASSKAVRLSGGNTISIETLTALLNDTKYYISLSKGFVVDSVGNDLKAFDGKADWSFTTKKATDNIKTKEIKVIGMDVTQIISDGNGGTETSATKAQVIDTVNNFSVNVHEDSSTDSTIRANVKPIFSVEPSEKEVVITTSNGITYEKMKDGSYDVVIPSGTSAANKTITITVKEETYTLKFVSYGAKWSNITTEVKAFGIMAAIPKMSLTNAIDISDIASTSNNVNIAIRFEADANEAKINATDVQSLKTAVGGNLKFIDLKLIKSVTIDNGIPTEENIHNTLAPIKVRLTLPTEIQGGQYTISVYRVHNDVVTLLNSTLVNNKKEVEFESDAYSTYAIKYDSEAIGTGTTTKADTVNDTPVVLEKSNPKDATVTVDKTKTVTSVTLNDQTIDLTNYKAGDGQIVLGKDKLTNLKEGSYTLKVTYNDKSTVTYTIKVVAYDEAITLTDVPVFYMTKSMSIGNKFALTMTGINEYAKVTYKTSNSKVVAVSSNGTIVAKKNGTADVTATITQKGSQYKVIIKIKVQKGMPFNRTIPASEAIAINTSLPVLNIYKRLYVGKKTNIGVKNIASDAVVSYSSDIKSVATVSKNGTITAISAGECVVTAKIKQNGKTYCYKVLVRVPESK